MSITSIYDERSKRARSAAVDHAAGQYALSAPKAPDSDLSATVAKLRSFSLLLCLNADLAAKMTGKSVKCYFNLPISFRVN